MQEKVKYLWELLVPTIRSNGRPIHTRCHRVWDAHVKEISGGLTIMHPTIGYWVNEGQTLKERMIPVRIICTKSQFVEILEMTRKFYEQQVITWYRLSSEAGFYDGTKETLPS